MQTQQIHTSNNLFEQNAQAPLVSFIITTYNLPSEYLELCLKSILKLSLNPKEREIIMIDDGSELSPIQDLMDYQDDIIYLRQRNQGLSMARNKGIQIATGKYIQVYRWWWLSASNGIRTLSGSRKIPQPRHCIFRTHRPRGKGRTIFIYRARKRKHLLTQQQLTRLCLQLYL